MNLIIRKINERDKTDFLEMGKEFYSSEAVLHNIGDTYHENTFRELMRSDMYLQCCFFEIENRIAGYSLLNKTFSREAGGAVIWIEELYVKPEYRGKGIGSIFFDWLEENIPAARYRLEIEPDNVRAQKLYKRKGYEELPYIQMIKE